MKYVQIDEDTGEISWDSYFEYLRSIQGRLPAALYSYASDWEHYSLGGRDSLHDAGLVSVQIGFRSNEVVLEFLGVRHDRKHVFTYLDVEQYKIDLDVTYKYGDRDVLAHEFRMDGGGIVHEIAFSDKRTISISAANVVPRVDVLS